MPKKASGKVGDVAKYGGMASGKASVELFFVDSYFDNPGSRLFDIALMGRRSSRILISLVFRAARIGPRCRS